ncbi:exonuclease domain-containing protein [Schinkia sp. CFF1]
MKFDPFIHWMKQIHSKLNSSIYGSLVQGNSQHLAFLRSLEKEIQRKSSLYAPLDELNVVVFDFETTGFNPEKGDQILSIGAVKLLGLGMSINNAETFYSLVRFEGCLSPGIKQLTGLKEEELKDAPPLSDVLVQFYQFVNGAPLVAHHANHEKKFLHQANWMLFKTGVKHRIVDTSLVFAVACPGAKLIRLEDYCQHCGLTVQDRHHALGDAQMTAQLWCIYVKKLYDGGCETLNDIYNRIALL